MQHFIYVGQYGAFWRLPLKDWVRICRRALHGAGYELPERYRLSRMPPGFLKSDQDHSAHHAAYCPRPGVLYVEPLDWEPHDFQNWLDTHLSH
jgi:hypothetical protein